MKPLRNFRNAFDKIKLSNMESEKLIDRKLNFLGLSSTYWNLVSASIEEMIETNNSHGGTIHPSENGEALFKENTKWNSSNIGIPIIYNFYHGFELFIKGIGLDFIEKNEHDLNPIIPQIKEKYQIASLHQLIDKYYTTLESNPFQKFFKIYKPSCVHLTLRFSESKKSKMYDTSSLYTQWKEGESIFDMGKYDLEKFQEIYDDISILNSLKPDLIEKF